MSDLTPQIEFEKQAVHWTVAHPAFEDEVGFGDRMADKLRLGMGSWGFVFCFLAFMAVWALLNGVLLMHGFDPYPFILLNLFLSMLAGLQGAILLIASKRADAIAGKLALHTDAQATETLEVVKRIEESLNSPR